MKIRCKIRHLSWIMASFILLACSSSPLPKGERVNTSPWQTFEEAKAAYDRIIPNETRQDDLKELGFDPYKTPNIEILTYLDIIQRFMPNQSVQPQDLPVSVRNCINAKDACSGLEAKPQNIKSKRIGSVFKDIFNFERRTIKSGWIFESLIVIQDDLVVYKLWSGTPNLNESRRSKRPLGPLQDSSGIVRGQVESQIIP